MNGFRLNQARVRVALLAALGVVPTAVVAPAALAAKDASSAPVSQRSGLLDPVVQLLLTVLGTLSPSALTSQLSGLTNLQLTQLLGAASPTQLTQILASLPAGQLAGVLGSLDPATLNSVVASLTGGELTNLIGVVTNGQLATLLPALSPGQFVSILPALSTGQLVSILPSLTSGQLGTVVSGLTPGQLSTLLGSGASLGSLLTGLQSELGGLGGAPSASALDGVIAQLTALISGGLPSNPTQFGQLTSLLNGLNPLLSTTGLDTSLLSGLKTTLQSGLGSVAPGLNTGPITSIVSTLTGLLGGSTG